MTEKIKNIKKNQLVEFIGYVSSIVAILSERYYEIDGSQALVLETFTRIVKRNDKVKPYDRLDKTYTICITRGEAYVLWRNIGLFLNEPNNYNLLEQIHKLTIK